MLYQEAGQEKLQKHINQNLLLFRQAWTKVNRMIMEHVNDLNTMAEQYETAENAAKSAASELPASTLD